MRRFAYLATFVICFVAVSHQTMGFLFPRSLPYIDLLPELAVPLPMPLAALAPYWLRTFLMLAFAALLYRRLWLVIRAKSLEPPASLAVWPGFLLVLAISFLLLGLTVLLLSIVLRAGSGVPGGMLLVPALFLISPVLFFVELTSAIRKSPK